MLVDFRLENFVHMLMLPHEWLSHGTLSWSLHATQLDAIVYYDIFRYTYHSDTYVVPGVTW